jgi:hypothetical protein
MREDLYGFCMLFGDILVQLHVSTTIDIIIKQKYKISILHTLTFIILKLVKSRESKRSAKNTRDVRKRVGVGFGF